MKKVKLWGIASLTIVLISLVFVYSGFYSVGADVPHNKVTYWLLETIRDQSIARASSSIDVPDLDSPDLLLAGGPDYNDMCATCHLKPGTDSSDMSIGLYPTPPNLSEKDQEVTGNDRARIARRQFWVIKHGIKASGMPAWGPTHDDERIWAMVAFLQRLPDLNAQQYQILTARGESEESTH